MKYRNISEYLYDLCNKYQNNEFAFTYKKNGEYQKITHLELLDKIECLAISFLELGIHKGDRVGLVAENSIEWIVSCFAINIIGAIDVPLFPILTAKQEAEIFDDCSATAIIVSTNFQLNKINEIKDTLPNLRHIIAFTNQLEQKDLYIHSLETLIDRGNKIRSKEERKETLIEIQKKISPDDLLTLIYTSGTTGKPKGVMLSQNNILSNVDAAIEILGSLKNPVSLMYLPLCHAYERTTGFYTLFASGAKIAIADSIETVPVQLQEIKPNVITSVPKLLETIRKKVYINISKESIARQKIFNWAIGIGIKKAYELQDGKNNSITNFFYKIAYQLVLHKIRERLGGQLEKIISGGAALPIEVEVFFRAIGINVQQGYGLTEASPVVTANREDDYEFGTIGKPLKGIEVKIAEDGEILVKGPNVMKGYWNNPEETSSVIDQEGWLHTGDIGEFTPKGNLKITDRKKYIFVNSGGKNIAPQQIETLITQSRYIDHCFLIGDNREYITALISPNFEQLEILAKELGIAFNDVSELISNQRIIKFIKDEIDFYQRDVSKFEKVRKFRLLSQPFSTSGGELTPKMSIRRNEVEKKYQMLIESMYNNPD
jgi:long-chain acyl-CoA synthetase